ncbi:S9 family peptidase [Litoribacter populi]|uniref:S9 family peptidase n=1 Tax=Litoribacter populi TaxID=2598460 RepID=UPI00118140F9|nr:DPP IV N-terminal domain-containing protein [Litoribacter populi]
MKYRLLGIGMMLLSFGAFGQESGQKGNYELAAKFSPEKVKKMVFSTQVDPHWLKKSDKFWYSYETQDGKLFYLVDPAKKTKTPLFDRDQLAMEITKVVKDPFDGQHLDLTGLRFLDDENTIKFKVKSSEEVLKKDWDKIKEKNKNAKDSLENRVFTFHYDLTSRELTEIEDDKEDKRMAWANIAPDSSKVVFAKHHNLYWMDKENFLKAVEDEKDSTIVEHQLTEDGEEYYDYGIGGRGEDNVDREKNKDKRKRAMAMWSPDAKQFVISRSDSRKVKDLWVIHNSKNPRPTLETYKYAMPGEKEQPVQELYHYSFTNEELQKLEIATFVDQNIGLWSASRPNNTRDDEFRPVIWLGDDEQFFFSVTSRDLKKVDIVRWNLKDNKKEVIVEERSNTYIDINKPELVNNGRDIIHWSERDGWGHLYLYGVDGTLKRQLTTGAFHVDKVERINEKNKKVYFVANGKEKGEDPYYEHLYSVSLDGGPMTLLNNGDFNHSSNVNDNATYFVNNYSRVDAAPVAELMDANGKKVMDLETTDLSRLFAAGYKFPKPFTFKADDGITDLFGVMYLPYDFDSTKSYPLIQYVYPGPQTEAVNKTFSKGMDRVDRLAQLGFVVVTIGNRGGHPGRSKWYHNYGYGNLRDYGLADKKAAVEQLADRHSFIDRSKVGIHGHSGGGFMSTAALLVYPDVFKVAVSSAGNHENNIYNRWWSEKHHGVKEVENGDGESKFIYDVEKNPDLAKNLKGHLLLVTGDVDNNVHPANTIRMANALIKANKRFDFITLPGQRHGFGDMTEYFFWRMGDYFVQHLLGDNTPPPVDMMEVQREKALTK